MSQKETIAILEAINENWKQTFELSWEQTRYICYIQALSQGAKFEKPSDLVRFNWDVDDNNVINSDNNFIERELNTLEWAKAALNITN
jgi:hypothetical protein